MDAVLVALFAVIAFGVATATVLSTLSKAAIFALLAIAPCIYRYRRRIYIIYKTLPRDFKFLWRYIKLRRYLKWTSQENPTMVDLFTKRAQKYPDAECVTVVDGRTWTFNDMATTSNQIARALQIHVNVKRGDVICILMPNSGEYICTWLGVAKLAGVSALLNTNLKHKPLLHCIQVAKAKAIVFTEAYAEAVLELKPQLPDLKLLQYDGLSRDGVVNLGSEMTRQSIEYPIVTESPQYRDVLFYIYTSGTTGMPKAALMPNTKYLLATTACIDMFGLRQTDRIYNPLPLYHTAGGMLGTAPVLLGGIPTVIRPKFSASNYWTDCIKYQCTVTQYIGEMCRYLLAQPPRPTDTQHKVRLMFGNGIRPAIWQILVDRFKVPLINEVYGATEGNTNMTNVDSTVGAVGFLPKIVPEFLHPVALLRADETGEILRGPDGFCMRCAPNEPGMFVGLIGKGDVSREFYGYVDKVESNRKLVRNVFRKGDVAFVSGDLLVADELGYLYFRERTGDTFRWKGENVSTCEIEDAMATAAEHRACVVYAVSITGTEGRAGMAAVATGGDALDLEAIARSLDHSLPPYARPLFIRVMKELETTGTFKLTKLQYQKEGFDPDVIKDPLYFRAPNGGYVPITTQLYSDICNGKVKL